MRNVGQGLNLIRYLGIKSLNFQYKVNKTTMKKMEISSSSGKALPIIKEDKSIYEQIEQQPFNTLQNNTENDNKHLKVHSDNRSRAVVRCLCHGMFSILSLFLFFVFVSVGIMSFSGANPDPMLYILVFISTALPFMCFCYSLKLLFKSIMLLCC